MLGCKSSAISVYRDVRLDEGSKRLKREAPLTTPTADDRINGRRPTSGGTQPRPAVAANTITPCAACKLLRRRCAQECPFSPYFSPHEPHKFASVHKVFGASNVSKMLMEVPETQRSDAANSLVYEANLRLRDPVYGCMGAIFALQQQAQVLERELNMVRVHILKLKHKRTSANVLPTSHTALSACRGASLMAVPGPLPPPPPPVIPHPAPSNSSSSRSSSSIYRLASNSDHGSNITTEDVPYFG